MTRWCSGSPNFSFASPSPLPLPPLLHHHLFLFLPQSHAHRLFHLSQLLLHLPTIHAVLYFPKHPALYLPGNAAPLGATNHLEVVLLSSTKELLHVLLVKL